jgi:hypothetical protein
MLEQLWKNHFNSILRKKFDETEIARQVPTIGVEHEFFLLNQNAELCNAIESQEFLKEISKHPLARVIRHIASGEITQINIEHPQSRSYSVIKYEFFPHLLEVAIGFTTRLDVLTSRIAEIFASVNKAATTAGLSISNDPQFKIGELSKESLGGFDEKRLKLHELRKSNLITRGLSVLNANFPAFTAGTQVQIGGLNWWDNPGLIGRLYGTEIETLEATYSSLGLSANKTIALLQERFSRYYAVYSEKLLLGFPEFTHWSIENWSRALTKDLGLPTDDSQAAVLELASKCHDLSLIAIKPMMATLEFRGAPSLFNEDLIIAEIHRRKLQFDNAVNSAGNPFLLGHRQKWERLIGSTYPMKKDLAYGS